MTEAEKYQKLLELAKWVSLQGCCNLCDCLACEAVKVLKEIGESKE